MQAKRKLPKRHLLAIELGHLSDIAISGGDLLLEKMSDHLPTIAISVIVPESGAFHWENSDVKIITLKKNFFDLSLNKFVILTSYLLRTAQALSKIYKTKLDILYSSTNIFPDVFTAFLFKITHKDVLWVSRIHHLLPKPAEREGDALSNFFAYSLEIITLKMSKKSDLIICLNHLVYLKLKNLGFNTSKLKVLGGGVNFSYIQKVKPKGLNYEGIFVGRLHYTKGIFDLLKIWKIVTASLPKARLVIVGEGKPAMIKGLVNQIKKGGLQNNVNYLGILPDTALLATLKSSKVFLFVDKEAGFGLAAAEAMAAGLPVVGWDIGILGTVFKSGFLKAPLNNNQVFARIVVQILRNNKMRKTLSNQAINEAKRFDWQKVSRNFEKLLKNL